MKPVTKYAVEVPCADSISEARLRGRPAAAAAAASRTACCCLPACPPPCRQPACGVLVCAAGLLTFCWLGRMGRRRGQGRAGCAGGAVAPSSRHGSMVWHSYICRLPGACLLCTQPSQPRPACLPQCITNAFRAAESIGRPGAAFVSLPQARPLGSPLLLWPGRPCCIAPCRQDSRWRATVGFSSASLHLTQPQLRPQSVMVGPARMRVLGQSIHPGGGHDTDIARAAELINGAGTCCLPACPAACTPARLPARLMLAVWQLNPVKACPPHCALATAFLPHWLARLQASPSCCAASLQASPRRRWPSATCCAWQPCQW